MKAKTLVTLALTAALLAGGVHAAPADQFPAVNTYPGYADVAEGDWFYANAKLCYEIGIMTGTDKGFEPNKTLTGPECAALAARLLEGLTGRPIPDFAPDPGLPWYQHYCDYLGTFIDESGSSLYGLIKWYDRELFEAPATRYDFLVFMALVTSGDRDYFPALNHLTYDNIPDVADDDLVLRFYNIGILTGKDKYGTFNGDGTLTRAEAAAMVSRMAQPALRLAFTPADPTPLIAAGVSATTPFFSDGVTAGEYLPALLDVIGELEAASADAGVEFNWFNTYGEDTFLAYAAQETLDRLGESKDRGLDAYKQFDIQVYYSKYLSLTGEAV